MAVAPKNPALANLSCERCGCTETTPCEEGCFWIAAAAVVGRAICSACVAVKDPREWLLEVCDECHNMTRPTPKPVVSRDHETWMGLAAKCMNRPLPKISLGVRDAAWKAFIARCTPGNVFAVLHAHARAIEAMVALARHLEQLPCICPLPRPRDQAAADAIAAVHREIGEAHLEVCPRFLRGHDAFERFDATAFGGPRPRPLTIVAPEEVSVPTVAAPPAPAAAAAEDPAPDQVAEALAHGTAYLPPAP
ncbi:MAG: hypothetical protein Q8Q14_12650 [Gemmatimonadales bacterium]|nr:hypothetical protein [Gemmatimonadales bacterium]